MERKILDLFAFNEKLKFNEIEKLLKVRSNELAYHLKKLVKKLVLEKKENLYHLSESSEYLIPYLSNKKHVLSVIIIHIGNNKEAFLIKREKRPYKGKLSLPGGRLIIGESIEQATKRIMKEKFNIKVKFKKVASITLEHLQKKGKTISSFLLIHVLASSQSKDNIRMTNLKENKSKIIKSDYFLMTSNFKKKVSLGEFLSRI